MSLLTVQDKTGIYVFKDQDVKNNVLSTHPYVTRNVIIA